MEPVQLPGPTLWRSSHYPVRPNRATLKAPRKMYIRIHPPYYIIIGSGIRNYTLRGVLVALFLTDSWKVRSSQSVKTKAFGKRLFNVCVPPLVTTHEGCSLEWSILPWSFTSRRNNANIWIFFFRKQILELFFLIFWLCVLLLRLAWCRVSHECYCVANIILFIHNCAILSFPSTKWVVGGTKCQLYYVLLTRP